MTEKTKTKDKTIQVGLENLTGADPQKDRQFVTALARGLEVLRCFRAGNPMLGNQEIAQKTGLPKPTVSRLTFTLTTLGYLRYSKNLRKYQLGTAVLALGYGLLTNNETIKIARPLLVEMADHAQAAVGLLAQDRLDMIYLENIIPNTNAIVLNNRPGDRLPLAITATGRAFLCGISETDRTYLMDQIRLRDEANWPTVKAGIEKALKDYHNFGYCMSFGEFRKNVNAIGVPIKTPIGGSNILVVNCGGASFQIRRHIIEDDLGPRLAHVADRIETLLLQI